MPTIKIYSKEQVDALIASAGGLPDPTSASAGDVLTLDSNKDPAWAEPDPGLPDTTSASAGDVLTLDSNKDPAWVAPSGGGMTLIGTYGGSSSTTANQQACHDALSGLGDGLYLIIKNPSGSTKEQFIISTIDPVNVSNNKTYLCLGGQLYYNNMTTTNFYIYIRLTLSNNKANLWSCAYNGSITTPGSSVLNYITIYKIA